MQEPLTPQDYMARLKTFVENSRVEYHIRRRKLDEVLRKVLACKALDPRGRGLCVPLEMRRPMREGREQVDATIAGLVAMKSALPATLARLEALHSRANRHATELGWQHGAGT